MRLYVEFARLSFRRHLTYRVSMLAGMVANTVFGWLLASVMTALYRSRTDQDASVQGFDLPEALTFIWLGQAMIFVVALWGWFEIAEQIRSGEVVNDLLRPFDYYLAWLFRDFGRAASGLLTRFVPTFAIGVLGFDLVAPESVSRLVGFALSLVLAVAVSFTLRFIINLSGFWTTDVRGTWAVSWLFFTLFAGFLIPIAFFPTWLRVVAEALPFRAVVMVPIDIYLGHGELWQLLGLQLGWLAALQLAARWLLRRAVLRLTVQGG